MESALHVIVGAGPVGSAVALQLAESGHRVRVVTRSGGGPQKPGIERVALDATDGAVLAASVRGAEVIYNCANPGAYPSWERGWPPLAEAILYAAETSGAVLATLSNLYGYGPVSGAMTREMPLHPVDHKGALRARMWDEALAAHQAGRVRVTEARASDYLGPTASTESSLLARYAAATLAGRPAWVFSEPDQPHAWTAVDDIAATLIALGGDERAWGSPWLVPSSPPATVRDVLTEMSRYTDAPPPRLRQVPRAVLTACGLVVPLLREVVGVLYQFDQPFLVDATETTQTFGVRATPWPQVVETTAAAWHRRAAD